MSEKESISLTMDVNVREQADVFVAGGGPAGLSAAIAAARQGASVFLCEMESCFGGMGTAGLVPIFCSFSDGENFLAGGIGREIYERCRDCGGFGPDYQPDPEVRRSSNPIHAEKLKRVYDGLVTESGVDFTFGTRLIAVNGEGGRVKEAICHGKSGLFAVRAKVFVDGTGDGDLAVAAGAEFEKGDPEFGLQAGTLCSFWSGIDWDRAKDAGMYDVWPRGERKRLSEAIDDGVFTEPDPGMPGIWPVGEGQGGGNIGHLFGVDGTDERSMTRALIRGRQKLMEYERYFKEYNVGFERMELAATGALLGIRETRRILGDYILDLVDYEARAEFPDEIGRYNYTVDIHPGSLEQRLSGVRQVPDYTPYGLGESYGIPYRILTPRKLENVLVAGRCVSTDRAMLGSIRVMPGCFITGQAAGVAAALTADGQTDTRAISVPDLQRRLKGMGAFLPNCDEDSV